MKGITMKTALLAIALFLSSAAHASPLTPDQVRSRVASIPEVKAVYGVYKGKGWSCENTKVIVSPDGGSFEAEKICNYKKGDDETSVFMTIKGFIYGEGKSSAFVVDSMNFNRAG